MAKVIEPPVPVKGSSPFVTVYTEYLNPATYTEIQIQGGFVDKKKDIPAVWKVIRAVGVYKCSAAVANRTIRWDLVDFGGDNYTADPWYVFAFATGNITANQTCWYNLQPVSDLKTGITSILPDVNYYACIREKQMIVRGYDRVAFVPGNQQSGDTFKCLVTLEYLNYGWEN